MNAKTPASPTMHLRYLRRPEGTMLAPPVLQQAHRFINGEVEWRDVPTEFERKAEA